MINIRLVEFLPSSSSSLFIFILRVYFPDLLCCIILLSQNCYSFSSHISFRLFFPCLDTVYRTAYFPLTSLLCSSSCSCGNFIYFPLIFSKNFYLFGNHIVHHPNYFFCNLYNHYTPSWGGRSLGSIAEGSGGPRSCYSCFT